MAAILKKHTGNVATKVSTILGTTAKRFRQFTIYGDPDAAGISYLGPSTVVAAGTDHTSKIKPGISISLGPQANERPFTVDTEQLFAVAQAGENLYFIVNTDDGGR